MPFGSSPASDQQVLYEGVRVQLTPAPILKRIIAFCIDMGVIMAIMYPLFFLAVIGVAAIAGIGEAFSKGAGGYAGLAALVIGLLVVFSLQDGYFILQEKKQGTTLGKRVFGLRVLSSDGKALSWGQAIIRDLMRYIDCFLVVPGLFSVALNEKRRRLGDFMAGTVVVYSASREKSGAFLYLSADEFAHLEQILQPKSVEAYVRAEYIKYAFKLFIAGGAKDQVVHDKWYAYLKEQAADMGSAESVPEESLLRFFADYFRQQQEAERKK